MAKRIGVYTVGILILALGIVLNTRTGLGVVSVASFAFAINKVVGISLGKASGFHLPLCSYLTQTYGRRCENNFECI